jgi:hypothetical protein
MDSGVYAYASVYACATGGQGTISPGGAGLSHVQLVWRSANEGMCPEKDQDAMPMSCTCEAGRTSPERGPRAAPAI